MKKITVTSVSVFSIVFGSSTHFIFSKALHLLYNSLKKCLIQVAIFWDTVGDWVIQAGLL